MMKYLLQYVGLAALLLMPVIQAGDTLFFEAEDSSVIKAPVKITEDTTASKGKCLEVTEGAGEGSKAGGSAVYQLILDEDGSYYFWSRVWWLDKCGNSFSVQFDQNPVFVFGNDRTCKSWHWVKSKLKLKFTKGRHQMTVSNREDGIKIDQFLLTKDRKLVPVDIEDSVKLKK